MAKLHGPNFGLFRRSGVVLVVFTNHVVDSEITIIRHPPWLKLDIPDGGTVVHSRLLGRTDGV